jgi:NAD(P)-dependent dehydrogenase (short-subunit alcohol dehydrogenase family)
MKTQSNVLVTGASSGIGSAVMDVALTAKWRHVSEIFGV